MQLPPQLDAKFNDLIGRYPVKRSALIPMMIYAQDEYGFLGDEILDEIAKRLDLNTVQVTGRRLPTTLCCGASQPAGITFKFAPTFPAWPWAATSC